MIKTRIFPIGNIFPKDGSLMIETINNGTFEIPSELYLLEDLPVQAKSIAVDFLNELPYELFINDKKIASFENSEDFKFDKRFIDVHNEEFMATFGNITEIDKERFNNLLLEIPNSGFNLSDEVHSIKPAGLRERLKIIYENSENNQELRKRILLEASLIKGITDKLVEHTKSRRFLKQKEKELVNIDALWKFAELKAVLPYVHTWMTDYFFTKKEKERMLDAIKANSHH